MNLEDHVGDVLAKARQHAGLSLETVAHAAGLDPAALATLEQTGVVPEPVRWEPLAQQLGLHAGKLAGLAAGWHPAPVDLGQWRELRLITSRGQGFSVNCYLVWDEVTRDAALFDTGVDAGPICALIERENLRLRHLFITHGHADHVAAAEALRRRFPQLRLRCGAKTAPVDQRLRPNEFIPLGSLRITYRETPGHAEDGVTYLIGNWPEDAPHVAVVGDAIFAGSMGRVAGEAAAAREVIRRQILSLPPETLICPGHGPLTTVAEERAHNPFF